MSEAKEIGIFKTRINEAIFKANEAFKELAKEHHYGFINVNQGLTDEKGIGVTCLIKRV
ncbi:hypothetical protein ACFQ5D_22155 [Paenibacillus farraposensis]|uniref:Uncharacterized protein n=1 Tax=Paenibacillus farraposensis TaxID=2807095 RepID=A0ABW4DJH8_9BACL|nr:hypothetical protein [Paenibacillus farraposensis]MCC3379648.1 hypothetical protein [Paenibacillus farraposensis]